MFIRILSFFFVVFFSSSSISSNFLIEKEKEYAGGSSDAAFKIGQMYELGVSVDKSLEKAINWYEKSERLGNPKASSMLGVIHFKKGDYQSSIFHLKKGVAKKEGLSYAYLGKIFKLNGFDKKAFQLFKKSAESGNPVGQYLLADSFENGFVAKKNIKLAIKWFKKSSEKKYSDSLSRVRLLKKIIK